ELRLVGVSQLGAEPRRANDYATQPGSRAALRNQPCILRGLLHGTKLFAGPRARTHSFRWQSPPGSAEYVLAKPQLGTAKRGHRPKTAESRSHPGRLYRRVWNEHEHKPESAGGHPARRQ